MKIVGGPLVGYTMEPSFDELELVSMGLQSGIDHASQNLADHPLVPREADEEQSIQLGELFLGTRESFSNLRQSIVDQLGYDPADG